MTEAELPTSLTVSYIVDTARAEGLHADPYAAKAVEERVADVEKYLLDNGVTLQKGDTDAAIQTVLAVVSSNIFWQKHASLHPQHRRVKNWLWVHGRYRAQAAAVLAAEDPQKQLAVFLKFQKKIEAHSEFEDTQLFKFFVDQGIGNKNVFKTLMEQHGNIRLVEEITEGLKKIQAGIASEAEIKETKGNLDNYVQDLKEHLDLEEKTIVGPWLQLTPKQYKTYRSYLSWTYCFVY